MGAAVSTSAQVVTTMPWQSCGCDRHVVIIAMALLCARGCAGQGEVSKVGDGEREVGEW